MKLRKWRALLKKDLKLTLSNRNIVLMFALPIIFAFVYKVLPSGDEFHNAKVTLTMVNALGLGIVGGSLMGMAIADEKEKKTLRSLMLSDVSGVEFIVSKLIIILLMFVLTMILCFFVVEAPLSYLGIYLLQLVLTSASLLLISSVIGLLAKNQQEVGVLGAPLMLVLMVPMFALMSDNKVINIVSKVLPSGPMTIMMMENAMGVSQYSHLLGYGTMIVWVVVAILAFSFIYKRKQMDN